MWNNHGHHGHGQGHHNGHGHGHHNAEMAAARAHHQEVKNEIKEERLHDRAINDLMHGNIFGYIRNENKAKEAHHRAEDAHAREVAAEHRIHDHHGHHGHHYTPSHHHGHHYTPPHHHHPSGPSYYPGAPPPQPGYPYGGAPGGYPVGAAPPPQGGYPAGPYNPNPYGPR